VTWPALGFNLSARGWLAHEIMGSWKVAAALQTWRSAVQLWNAL